MTTEIINGEEWLVTTTESGHVIRELVRPTPTPSAADLARKRLAEIDVLADSPRARREAILGNTSYIAALEAEAATLRAELKVMEGE